LTSAPYVFLLYSGKLNGSARSSSLDGGSFAKCRKKKFGSREGFGITGDIRKACFSGGIGKGEASRSVEHPLFACWSWLSGWGSGVVGVVGVGHGGLWLIVTPLG
jgi:hypothetical protein